MQVIYQPKGERVSHFRPWLDFHRNSAVFSRLIFARIFRIFRPMNGFWYKLLTRAAGFCGAWLFVVVSRIIAAGFFILSKRVPESRRFYAALYPERGRLYHLWCTFLQYQNFTTIHFDRFLARQNKSIVFTSEGWEKLAAVIGHQGGILLMSHLGNWEIAATLLKQQRDDLQLLLYMGVKEKEGIERLQKDQLRQVRSNDHRCGPTEQFTVFRSRRYSLFAGRRPGIHGRRYCLAGRPAQGTGTISGP